MPHIAVYMHHLGADRVEIVDGNIEGNGQSVPVPSLEVYQQWKTDLEEYLASTQYQRDRVSKPEGYASNGDQFAMMYDDLKNGTTKWKEHNEAVRLAIPNPSE